MGEETVLTVAQATSETPETPAAPAIPADAATAAPEALEPAAGATDAPEEGLIETIIDAVTDTVEEVIPGAEDEPAGEAGDQATGQTPGGAVEGADEGLIETIIDAVTDAVEEVVPGVEGGTTGQPVPDTAETIVSPDDLGAADDHDVIAPELWLVLALVALVVIAFRPARRAIIGSLDGRAGRIRDELEEAQRLREEAQAALANFQRQQRDALGEAGEIIAHAQAEAERLREHAADDMEETLKRRESMALDRIAQAEAAAVAEVRGVAVDVAISAARDVIGAKLDKSKSNALIDDAIKDLPNRLH